MRMSGTKPMKNTMRKQSPIKFFTPIAGMDSVKKATDAVSAAYKAKKAKSAGTTKGATTSGTYTTKKKDTKPATETSIKTGTIKSKPAAETSVKTIAPKPNPAGKPSANPAAAETSAKTPPIQMKKYGKKC